MSYNHLTDYLAYKRFLKYVYSNITLDVIIGIFLYELNNMKEYFAYKKINTNFLKRFITQF